MSASTAGRNLWHAPRVGLLAASGLWPASAKNRRVHDHLSSVVAGVGGFLVMRAGAVGTTSRGTAASAFAQSCTRAKGFEAIGGAVMERRRGGSVCGLWTLGLCVQLLLDAHDLSELVLVAQGHALGSMAFFVAPLLRLLKSPAGYGRVPCVDDRAGGYVGVFCESAGRKLGAAVLDVNGPVFASPMSTHLPRASFAADVLWTA